MVKTKLNIPEEIVFLHLEDMPNIHETMMKDLRSIGVKNKVIHALNLREAIKGCKENDIGFIISDWNLPDGTGMDFLKKVRSSKKYATTPFLMCTTMDEVEDMINALNEGASEYLVKPWKAEELLEKLVACWNTL